MMARMQITMDPELQRRVRQRATELGVSIAEYIRSLAVKDLSPPKPKTEISAIFDLGDCAGTDVAKEKHQMLGDAEWQAYQRQTGRA